MDDNKLNKLEQRLQRLESEYLALSARVDELAAENMQLKSRQIAVSQLLEERDAAK